MLLGIPAIIAVNQVAAIAGLCHQARIRQFLEMERQGVAGDFQLLDDGPWGQPIRPGDNQGTEHAQAVRLGQRRKRFDDFIVFHDSIIVE